MAKAADLVGTLAKQQEELSSRIAGTTAKAKGMLEQTIDRTKGVVAKVALAHYIVAGLSIGSMLLILYGGFLTLSKSMDPAAAAGLLGACVALILTGATLFFTRPRGD